MAEGVRAPLGELTRNQCSNRPMPMLQVATLPKFLLQCQVQFWA